MSAELDEVRREVAAAHGLGPDAVSFLSGATADEVEASARQLAQLVHAGGPNRQPEPAGRNIFAEAMAQKQQRKRQLARMFSGGAAQPRDEHGRYTGVDGGARRSLPVAKPPEQAHGELVGQLAALRQLGGPSF